jgi:predicted RNA methylase
MPAGGDAPRDGETLDALCGNYRIFQFARGQRFTTDDVLSAWYATQWAPRVERAADLGSGIGSIALMVAWRLPGARIVTVEIQECSAELARRSVRYNGLDDRVRVVEGDLRDPAALAGEEPFDLVTASPPYFTDNTVSEASHEQAVTAVFHASRGPARRVCQAPDSMGDPSARHPDREGPLYRRLRHDPALDGPSTRRSTRMNEIANRRSSRDHFESPPHAPHAAISPTIDC